MAIAHVQSKGVDSGSVTTANLAFTSNIAASSLLIAAVRIGNVAGSVTSMSDTRSTVWARAQAQAATGAGEALEVWYAMNTTAGACTVTVNTTPSATVRWIIHEYSGLATAAALDQHVSNIGSGTAPDSSNATTTLADELLFCAAEDASGTTYTEGASYTKRVVVATKIASEDRIVTGTLTTSGSWSVSDVVSWACVLATFKMAAAGGGRATRNTHSTGLGMQHGVGLGMPAGGRYVS